VCNSFVCCQSAMPAADMTTGIAMSDYHLYVTARPTGGSTIAWALTCQQDGNGRPIAGHANFSPSRMALDADSKPLQLSTAIHELTHALGECPRTRSC
jgi:leishmanolysin